MANETAAGVEAEPIAALREQLAQLERSGSAEHARLLHELAWELRNRDATEAERFAEESLQIAQRLRDDALEAYALVARGYASLRQSHGAEAIVDAKRAADLFRAGGDQVGLQRALNTLGIAYGDSSRFMDALEIFLSLQRSHAETGNQQGEADALNNVGVVYVNLDDHTAALEYHMRSLRIARDAGYASGEVRSLTNLGTVVYELGRYDEALEYLQQSLEKRSDDDPHTYGLTLVNVGRCHHQLGRNEEAIGALEQGQELLASIDHTLGVANAHDSIGDVLLATNDPERALQHLQLSLAIKENADDRKGLAATMLRMAACHRALEHHDDARAALEESLAQSSQIGARTEAYRAHLALSELAEDDGDLAAALEHFKAHNRIKSELFNDTSDVKLRALRVGFEVEQAQKESEIYRLRNVELAKANEELESLARSLREADAQKSRLLRQVEQQARVDALTGLHNRRFFDRAIGEVFPETRLRRAPISIALCDVDDFKHVNDTFGHAVGDEVLRIVARLFEANTRGEDVVARYGGEEFIVMLPNADPGEALTIAERIRRAVEECDWSEIDPDLRVTLSVGLASDPDLEHHERLISKADDQLYAAKGRGKNVVVADVREPSNVDASEPTTDVRAERASVGPPGDLDVGARDGGRVLPAGLVIRGREDALETVTTQVGSISLLTSRPNLEVSEGWLESGGRMTLVPSQEPDGDAESYYVLSGTLEGHGANGPYAVRSGEQITADGLVEPVTLTAVGNVRFLYASPKPTFHEVSDELDDLRRLAVGVEFVDGYTADHCRRLQSIAYAVGRELGLPRSRLHLLDYGAYLHDVGKIRVPTEILRSQDKLTPEQWEIIRKHPSWGAQLLAGTFMSDAAKIVEQHHERLDGSGYPHGLAGNDVLIEAYIVAVADTFDAMTFDRPYRRAFDRATALEQLRSLRGVHFPAKVVDAFEKVLPRLRL